MKLIVLVGMCAVAWGQSGIGRPQLGEMLDQRGSLRRVFGVTGSFTVDEPRAARVLSTTCSRALCVAKTDSAILLGHTTMAAPSGPALIAVDGVTALIYFTEPGNSRAGRRGS